MPKGGSRCGRVCWTPQGIGTCEGAELGTHKLNVSLKWGPFGESWGPFYGYVLRAQPLYYSPSRLSGTISGSAALELIHPLVAFSGHNMKLQGTLYTLSCLGGLSWLVCSGNMLNLAP